MHADVQKIVTVFGTLLSVERECKKLGAPEAEELALFRLCSTEALALLRRPYV